MVLSMTGFGHAEGICNGKKISINIKSLNNKGLDLNLRMPFKYKDKEFEIRKILGENIFRGKVDFYLSIENIDIKPESSLNSKVIKNYMEALAQMAPESTKADLLKIAITLPEAVSSCNEGVEEAEWTSIKQIINEALSEFIKFRQTEGQSLKVELENYVKNIEDNLKKVLPFKDERMALTKEKLQAGLKDFKEVDESRFYQELVYYIEKLDISEEKVRLTQHCKYYLETLNSEQNSGKKLGFIAQEMGREINTLGSKANHQKIQKLVVNMKDELEKIKEQNLNVL